MKLLFREMLKFALGIVAVGVMLFLPAGTFAYRGAILLMALLFIPMLLAGTVLFFKKPQLLEKRIDVREKYSEQQAVVKLSGIMFVAGFVTAGLDFRYGWTSVHDAVVWVSAAIFLFSYLLYAAGLKRNEYLSRTIRVEKDQKVIDSGVYSVVRHPMYLATVIMFLLMPLILGSLISFAVFLTYPFIIALRIIHEEKILENELCGYMEYKKKVKYRLIPFVW